MSNSQRPLFAPQSLSARADSITQNMMRHVSDFVKTKVGGGQTSSRRGGPSPERLAFRPSRLPIPRAAAPDQTRRGRPPRFDLNVRTVSSREGRIARTRGPDPMAPRRSIRLKLTSPRGFRRPWLRLDALRGQWHEKARFRHGLCLLPFCQQKRHLRWRGQERQCRLRPDKPAREMRCASVFAAEMSSFDSSPLAPPSSTGCGRTWERRERRKDAPKETAARAPWCWRG